MRRPAACASRRPATSRATPPRSRALPFDESFALAAGEDRDWCARLVAAGGAPAPRAATPWSCTGRSSASAGSCASRCATAAARSRSAPRGGALAGAGFYRELARGRAARGCHAPPRSSRWRRPSVAAGARDRVTRSSGSPARPSRSTPQTAATVAATSARRGGRPLARGRRVRAGHDDRPGVAGRVVARAPAARAAPQDVAEASASARPRASSRGARSSCTTRSGS